MANSNPIISQPSPPRIVLFGAGRHVQHHARAILRYAELDPLRQETESLGVTSQIRSLGFREGYHRVYEQFSINHLGASYERLYDAAA